MGKLPGTSISNRSIFCFSRNLHTRRTCASTVTLSSLDTETIQEERVEIQGQQTGLSKFPHKSKECILQVTFCLRTLNSSSPRTKELEKPVCHSRKEKGDDHNITVEEESGAERYKSAREGGDLVPVEDADTAGLLGADDGHLHVRRGDLLLHHLLQDPHRHLLRLPQRHTLEKEGREVADFLRTKQYVRTTHRHTEVLIGGRG